MSDKKTSELLKCPFCNLPFKKIGSKRRGNQHYIHDKYMESDCILKEFGFKASEENFERWNTRIPMQNIVERLEEELRLAEEERDRCVIKALPYYDNVKGYATGMHNAIEIIREEGVMHELSS